jgi:hypothetical protein
MPTGPETRIYCSGEHQQQFNLVTGISYESTVEIVSCEMVGRRQQRLVKTVTDGVSVCCSDLL